MNISLTQHYRSALLTEAFIEKVVKAVAKRIAIDSQYQLSVVLVDDKEMRALNSEHRQENAVTDILSFTYDDTTGELVLCYPQIQRQADHKVQPIRKELTWLLIHGILHLHGYDHESPEDAKIMRPLEKEILCLIFDN